MQTGLGSTSESVDAREVILASIRASLAESARVIAPQAATSTMFNQSAVGCAAADDLSPVCAFRNRVESVGGHCIIVRHEDEAAQALNQIVSDLNSVTAPKRVALSNAPLLADWGRSQMDAEFEICPGASDLFSYDIGVTMAQAAIAETGTLVLESEKERHRLISLLPPVHVAIVRAADICLTIGDVLKRLRAHGNLSRAITFITGPSRTADIELTLTIGVHGPQELYVIVIEEGDDVA